MPHSTRRVCRAAARGMQTETPPKQAALARQVRQRMNRLGKPEHRARFCFFSKKKSLAGMRRFPIPSKSKFGWTLAAAFSILATPKTLFQPPSLAGACATTSAKTTVAHAPPSSHAGWREARTTPPQVTAFAARPASSRPLELFPYARMRRARAGFEHATRCAKSMPRPPPGGCKRKRRPNRRLWRGKCGKG